MALGFQVLRANAGFFSLASLPLLGMMILVPNLNAVYPETPWSYLASFGMGLIHLLVIERTQRHLLELPRRNLFEALTDWISRIPSLLGLGFLLWGLSTLLHSVLRTLSTSSPVGLFGSGAGIFRALGWVLVADFFFRLVAFSLHEVVLETQNPWKACKNSLQAWSIPLVALWASFSQAVVGGLVVFALAIVVIPILWLDPFGSTLVLVALAASLVGLGMVFWLQVSWTALHLSLRQEEA